MMCVDTRVTDLFGVDVWVIVSNVLNTEVILRMWLCIMCMAMQEHVKNMTDPHLHSHIYNDTWIRGILY